MGACPALRGLHTNCGKRCEQDRHHKLKYLIPLDLALQARFLGRLVSPAHARGAKHLAARPWGRAGIVPSFAEVWLPVRFYTNFVEKTVSKDLDLDQSP